ncbi:MAG: serine/threonine protein kinase, partial [Deltaproteobacteria bacterium]|nr:serine/threonine protein kinase [Deltaproteobacteria bacterium]
MREATQKPSDPGVTPDPVGTDEALITLGDDELAQAYALSATIADAARGNVSTTPGPDGEELSIAVTREHPGRYRGPRKDGTGPIEIGRGGIGRVLIAHDAHLGREVAVKELLSRPDEKTGSKSSTNPRESLVAARFLREARLTGQLEHPNIVPVYELGRRPDGTLYYTMKVVRGKDLATAFDAVKGHGVRARMRLLKHYADLCDAIAYAHSRGVVHRDIKPENVMVGEFGETVVLDWGLAKPRHARDLHDTKPDGVDASDAATIPPGVDLHPHRGAGERAQAAKRGITTSDDGKEEDLAATADGTLLGTPLYMSPEQAQGDLAQIDERSDVWSLGVMLYEILTGEPPFWAKTAVELLIKIVRGDFEKVAHRCPEAPPELAAIAEKALSRNPADRYRDAREMAEEVRAYLTGGRVQAYNYGAWTLAKRWAARHKPALVVASLAVVALITVGVLSVRSIAVERDRAMEAHAQAVSAMNVA